MSILETEPVRVFITRFLPIGLFSPSDDAIEEYVDFGLEQSNSERAEKIASRVRDNGIKRYGEKWAEYEGLLKDGRSFFLQASDDALVVNIASIGNGDLNEHARWDRKKKILDTFDQTDPDRLGCMFMYNQFSSHNERIPATLTRFEVSRKFAVMLGQIDRDILPLVFRRLSPR